MSDTALSLVSAPGRTEGLSLSRGDFGRVCKSHRCFALENMSRGIARINVKSSQIPPVYRVSAARVTGETRPLVGGQNEDNGSDLRSDSWRVKLVKSNLSFMLFARDCRSTLNKKKTISRREIRSRGKRRSRFALS